jgi:hypothetical protein
MVHKKGREGEEASLHLAAITTIESGGMVK